MVYYVVLVLAILVVLMLFEDAYYVEHNMTIWQKIRSRKEEKAMKKDKTYVDPINNKATDLEDHTVKETTTKTNTSLQSRLNKAKEYHKYYGEYGDKLAYNMINTAEDLLNYLAFSNKVYVVSAHKFKTITNFNTKNKLITFDDGTMGIFAANEYAMIPEEEV